MTVAPKLAPLIESRFTDQFGTTGLGNRILCIVLIGLGIWILLASAINVLSTLLIKTWPQLEQVNRWLGFVVGALQGFAAVVLFLCGMLVIEPTEVQHAPQRDPQDTVGQLVSNTVLTVAKHSRESKLGPLLAKYNPFERIPQLNKLKEAQQTIEVLKRPDVIDKLIRHPNVHELRTHPEFRRAIEQIEADPTFPTTIQDGQTIDRASLWVLLQHPAVLQLIDHPDFMDKASKVIREIDIDEQRAVLFPVLDDDQENLDVF